MVNEYDKSVLIAEHLNTQSAFDITPLQSIAEVDWHTTVMYNAPDTSQQAWNKETLIAIREFEKSVRGQKDWKNLCLADPVENGAVDEVACRAPKSFQTPLGLLGDAS